MNIYKCIYQNKNNKRWIAELSINKKKRYLGCYSSKEDAVLHTEIVFYILKSNIVGESLLEQKITSLFDKGVSIKDISNIINYNRPTVVWFLLRLGKNTETDFLKLEIEDMRSWVEEKISIGEIQKITGLSRRIIQRNFKKAQLPLPLSDHLESDYVGKKYGSYTLLRLSHIEKNKHRHIYKYVSLCDCGKEKIVDLHSLRFRLTECFHGKTTDKGNKSKNWKGFEDISASKWNSIKLGASRRNLTFDITIEYGWELFLKQNKKCKLTGLDICFPNSASLDRIDSSKGYSQGNIQWVHKGINFFKGNLNDEDFIIIANLVSQQHPKDINDSINIEKILEKTLFLNRKRKSTYKIMSPDDEIFITDNLLNFSKKHKLEYSYVKNLRKRKTKKSGWRVYKLDSDAHL